jgi:hypothetical protein
VNVPRVIGIQDLLGCAAMLERTYGTRVVRKADSRFMRAAGWALQALGILRRDRFMEDFTTTIGRTIYLSHYLGSGDASPAAQLRTLAHEHQHVVQERRGGLGYYLGYAFSRARRARYEAEAYATGLEIDRLLGARIDPDAEAELIDGYGFDAAAQEVFRSELGAWWDRIQAGEHTEVGGKVINWLCQRAADEVVQEIENTKGAKCPDR